MKSLYLSIGLVASMIGVSTKTLRRWDKKGSFSSAFRTKGNHIINKFGKRKRRRSQFNPKTQK